jgi:hypothetical protein
VACQPYNASTISLTRLMIAIRTSEKDNKSMASLSVRVLEEFSVFPLSLSDSVARKHRNRAINSPWMDRLN